jgi:hypothetical protein
LFLHTDVCLVACPSEFYPVPADQECLPCTDKCKTCTTDSDCQACTDATFENGLPNCVDSCPDKFYPIPGSGTPVPESSFNVCDDCLAECATCTDNVSCITCPDGSYLKAGRCLADCGSGFIENDNDNICDDCDVDNCDECSAVGTCTTCKNGFVFLRSTTNVTSCPATCPIHYYKDVSGS